MWLTLIYSDDLLLSFLYCSQFNCRFGLLYTSWRPLQYVHTFSLKSSQEGIVCQSFLDIAAKHVLFTRMISFLWLLNKKKYISKPAVLSPLYLAQQWRQSSMYGGGPLVRSPSFRGSIASRTARNWVNAFLRRRAGRSVAGPRKKAVVSATSQLLT